MATVSKASLDELDELYAEFVKGGEVRASRQGTQGFGQRLRGALAFRRKEDERWYGVKMEVETLGDLSGVEVRLVKQKGKATGKRAAEMRQLVGGNLFEGKMGLPKSELAEREEKEQMELQRVKDEEDFLKSGLGYDEWLRQTMEREREELRKKGLLKDGSDIAAGLGDWGMRFGMDSEKGVGTEEALRRLGYGPKEQSERSELKDEDVPAEKGE